MMGITRQIDIPSGEDVNYSDGCEESGFGAMNMGPVSKLADAKVTYALKIKHIAAAV